MHPKPFSPVKRAIVAALPIEKLFALALEVSSTRLRFFVRRFKPVDGFRPGTQLDTQQRLRVFFQGREKWSETEWEWYKELWLEWVHTHVALDEALNAFDNSDDFPEDGEPVPPNSSLDIRCFQYLASQDVPRQLIERFYEFGYFLPSESIEAFIQLSKSESELNLPYELEATTSRVKILEDQLGDLRREFKEVSAQLSQTITDSASKWDNAVTVKMAQSVQRVQEDLIEQVDAIRRDLNQVRTGDDQLRTWVSDSLHSLEKRLTDSVDELRAVVRDLSSRHRDEQVVRPDSPEPPKSPIEVGMNVPSILVERQIEVIDLSQVSECDPYQDVDSAIKALGTNFRSLGLKAEEAFPLANEVIAALLAGQIPMFHGTLAAILSQVCAQTLACNNHHCIRIPIGLLDGRAVRSTLDSIIMNKQRTGPAAVVFEGLNLSAIEAYGDGLRKIVSERLLGVDRSSRPVLIIGTILGGTGALDVTAELCDLGPVLYTDSLFMKTQWTYRPLQHGWLEARAWLDWADSYEKRPEGWDEAYEFCIDSLGLVPPLLKRSLFAAYSFLIPPEPRPETWPTRLQSLVCGWVLPRLLAEGSDLAEWAEQESVAGGQLDGNRIHRRIARLISGTERSDD